MKSLDRRSLGYGALVGAGAMLMLAIGTGVGRTISAGEPVVTFGGDGSHAYLWRVSGDQLVFVSSARADRGKGGGDEDHGKPDDEKGGKPDKGDKEKGDKDKGDKDKDDKGGGKGKGKGGG